MIKKYPPLSPEEQGLFQEAMSGTRVLLQDRIIPYRQVKQARKISREPLFQQQIDASQYFSDEFQPLLDSENLGCYHQPGVNQNVIKKLKRGDYVPALFLDVHGLTQSQAKWALAAFMVTCCRDHISCSCVIHGHGKHILKQRIPFWLAQHPAVLAFHQAPKKWGGSAALLLLMGLAEG